MINVSNEYRNKISGDRKFRLYADISLFDGTVLKLDDTDIMQGGMEIEDAVSGDGSFQIGAAIIGKNTITLNNYKGKFDAYDFTGATVVPYVGLELSSSIEKLKKGYYTVDDPNVAGNMLVIESLDNMTKFEKDFSGVQLAFPITAVLALDTICTYCGVTLSTLTFPNSDYVIQSKPSSDAITCLDMVSYIAQIAGCYARCNVDGALEIKWYDLTEFEKNTSLDGGTFFTTTTPYSDGDTADGGNFLDYSSGINVDGGNFTSQKKYHHIYDFGSNPTIAVDDVVITGIQVTDNAEAPNTILFGSAGYILSISGNPLIQSQSDANIISNSIGARIVGMRFRPFSASVLSNPAMEAGDPVFLSIRTNRGYFTYQSFITSLSLKINSRETIKCSAETPSKNSSKSYSAETKAVIETRKSAERKITSYDLTVQQLTNLITNGFGMFKTEVEDGNGGKIYYMHDKPTMPESSVRWFMTSEGMIEQNQIDGKWETVSGTDKHGNALYNVLTARKISADLIRTGKIISDDGSVLIDMALGVANSDNFSASDNVANNYPLRMPFNIDDSTSKITKVQLKYTLDKFRTYSDGASSGGGTNTTSSTDESLIVVSEHTGQFETNGMYNPNMTIGGGSCSAIAASAGWFSDATGSTTATSGVAHSHAYGVPSHQHIVDVPNHSHALGGNHTHMFRADHTHLLTVTGHNHTLELQPHTHDLNFGIMETNITDYSFDIYIDGVLKQSITNDIANIQGVVDLTAYITTVGWHTIELRSTTLKRISARVIIKSYIKN